MTRRTRNIHQLAIAGALAIVTLSCASDDQPNEPAANATTTTTPQATTSATEPPPTDLQPTSTTTPTTTAASSTTTSSTTTTTTPPAPPSTTTSTTTTDAPTTTTTTTVPLVDQACDTPLPPPRLIDGSPTGQPTQLEDGSIQWGTDTNAVRQRFSPSSGVQAPPPGTEGFNIVETGPFIGVARPVARAPQSAVNIYIFDTRTECERVFSVGPGVETKTAIELLADMLTSYTT